MSLVFFARAASAQEPPQWAGLRPVAPLLDETPAAQPHLRMPSPAGRPTVLVPLYFSFAGLQALDVVSTLGALNEGHRERNPAMGWLVQHPGALVAAKVGVAAGTVYLSERLWKKNRTAAVVLMIALNGAYAAVVANNHAAAR
jgi:hypothetical protein